MDGAGALTFAAFDGAGDPLVEIADVAQARYLRWYLADLGAAAVVVEPSYFDRDYLSEFAAFYCTSVAGYPNRCQRAHYFSRPVDRALLIASSGGEGAARDALQTAYLGFIVRRPIPAAPLGRTVLRWYPDGAPALPRVVEPSRDYVCHLAGIELRVRGLAWQQQDTGVGACATVALWSMLHSSALDDRHVVPTTAEVTNVAHRAGFSADRPFPSRGLTISQLIAAVRDSGFAPMLVAGERPDKGFSRKHFCSALASFVRSGYPVLLAGRLDHVGLHAVCAVGFRQAAAVAPAPGELVFEDAAAEFVYVHDDNLGPAARFRIREAAGASPGRIELTPEPPPKQHSLAIADPTVGYGPFVPEVMLVAAHEDVRVSPDALHQLAAHVGATLIAATANTAPLSASSRIARLAVYLGAELERVLGDQPATLAATRMALVEDVPPMSLHVGLVRLGLGGVPLVDVLYDTTDSAANTRPFCHVVFHPAMGRLIEVAANLVGLDLGKRVDAYGS